MTDQEIIELFSRSGIEVYPDHLSSYESETVKMSCARALIEQQTIANPELLRQWAESADHPALTPEERELRLKGHSYFTHCRIELPDLDAKGFPKTLFMAVNCTGVGMVGISNMAIVPEEKYESVMAALEYLASEEAAFSGGSACSEYARATLDRFKR